MFPKFTSVQTSARHRALSMALLISMPVVVGGQVVGSPPPRQSRPAKAPSALESEILKASAAWTDALMHRDLEALDSLQTTDFLTIQEARGGVAVMGRETQREHLKRGALERPTFERSLADVKVRRYGDVAVLTAFATFKGRNAAGRLGVSQAVITEIWVRQEGEWRLSHFQAANVPPKVPSPNK